MIPSTHARSANYGHKQRRVRASSHAGPRRAGSAVGLALGTLGLPFVRAALGLASLRAALTWDLVNTAAGALRRLCPACGAARGPPRAC